MKYLILEEVDSTNSYVSRHASELDDMTMVAADTQTAGRGQRGNSWESQPGLNLTATLFVRPRGIAPREQFAISEATALAVVDWLRAEGVEAKVKWPNDIYVGDRKICGILIEHAVTASAIEHSRIGFGVNVNQREFLSDAPNPVSLVQLTGRTHDINRVAAAMGARMEERLALAYTPEGRARLHADFMANLWRGDGMAYLFRRRADGVMVLGTILRVDPEGPLAIRNEITQREETFMFKEVEFLLDD